MHIQISEMYVKKFLRSLPSLNFEPFTNCAVRKFETQVTNIMVSQALFILDNIILERNIADVDMFLVLGAVTISYVSLYEKIFSHWYRKRRKATF